MRLTLRRQFSTSLITLFLVLSIIINAISVRAATPVRPPVGGRTAVTTSHSGICGSATYSSSTDKLTAGYTNPNGTGNGTLTYSSSYEDANGNTIPGPGGTIDPGNVGTITLSVPDDAINFQITITISTGGSVQGGTAGVVFGSN